MQQNPSYFELNCIDARLNFLWSIEPYGYPNRPRLLINGFNLMDLSPGKNKYKSQGSIEFFKIFLSLSGSSNNSSKSCLVQRPGSPCN